MMNQQTFDSIAFAVNQALSPNLAKQVMESLAADINELIAYKKKEQEATAQTETPEKKEGE